MTEPTLEQPEADLIAGLRSLAGMLEARPDLARRIRYSSPQILVSADDKQEVAEFVRAAKAHGATITKSASDASNYFSALCQFGRITLDVYVPREEMCERVVVGTETVTTKVPDPVALAAVPHVEVTETVEKVEWRCHPIMAPVQTAGASAAEPVGA